MAERMFVTGAWTNTDEERRLAAARVQRENDPELLEMLGLTATTTKMRK